MKIRFLYFKGCPNAEPALKLLKETIKEKGLNEEVEVIDVESEEEAREYHFLGSPTIQINGLDIEKPRLKDSPLFGCRVYVDKGRTSGVPPKAMILEALKEAKKSPG